jgi:hypothetical protein
MNWAHRALNGTADHTTVPEAFVTVADTHAWMSTEQVRFDRLMRLVDTPTGAPVT